MGLSLSCAVPDVPFVVLQGCAPTAEAPGFEGQVADTCTHSYSFIPPGLQSWCGRVHPGAADTAMPRTKFCRSASGNIVAAITLLLQTTTYYMIFLTLPHAVQFVS